MDKCLKGKIAVVTGASQGIGKSIAVKLAGEGAKVFVVARDRELIDKTVAEITSNGGNALGYVVDVASKTAIDNFCADVLEKEGVDIYVNNAGVTAVKNFIDTTEEDIDRIFNINLKGAIFFLQNISRIMINRKKGGNIIIVTSVNAIKPLPTQAFYSSTKASLESLMQSLAVDLAEHSIRVNSIAPGAILTAMNGQLSKEFLAEIAQTIPLKRIGVIDEIGELAVFLASDKASYITGSTFVADG